MAMGLLPPVVATLVADIHQFSAEMDKAKAQMSAVGSSGGAMMNKLGAGVALAGVGIAAASVKMASDFQTQMTRLYTAAGAPEAAVKGATDQVLALGNSVGYSGTQIAEALYHPVSAGLDLATSLQVVKYAAEEAQISGASLDDTTYSLSSVMKAFNEPASQAGQTMALLNAIVGQGDMRFQDFNVSIKNWAPTAAQMGISVQSMGAALAYLTDRGNSAEEAATRVTMGLTMMATPSKQAAKLLEGLGVASSDVSAASDAMTTVLKKTGITQNELAADLQKPDGIYVALKHLQLALDAAGVHGTEADSVLSKIFGGGRSDKAILSLMQNLDGLKTKFDDTGTAAGQFGEGWAQTQQTFAYQMRQVGAEVENIAIKFGTLLIPVIQDVVGWFSRNQWAADALAGVIGTVLVASLVKFSITATTTVVQAIGKMITGLATLGTTAETTALEEDTATASSGRLSTAMLAVGGAGTLGVAALLPFATHISLMSDQANKATTDVSSLTKTLTDAASGSSSAAQQLQLLGASAVALSADTGSPSTDMKTLDQALAQLVANGHAGTAAKDLDVLKAAMDRMHEPISGLTSRLPAYAQALQDAADKSKAAGDAAKNAGPAIAGTTDPLNQAAAAAQGTADAVNAVSDAFTQLSGNITASTAIDGFKKDLLSVTDELKKNGTSLGDDSLAGLANRDAFRNAADEILKYRDAQIKNGESTDQANQDAANQAAQLIKVWEQLGANKTQVEAYAKELGLVPKDLYTRLNMDTSSALNALQAVRDQINATLNAAGGSSSGGGLGHGALPGYDTGGWVNAPKGAPQLAIVHGGEFVLSNDMLAGSASVPSLPSMPLGARGGAPVVYVDLYLDGKKLSGSQRTQVLRYDLRNSRNNLSLSGFGG